MSRALCICWHQYPPLGINDYHRVYFELFKQNLALWSNEIDHLYLIDHHWRFTDGDISFLNDVMNGSCSILKFEYNHWDNVKTLLPVVKEDNVLLMDSDMYVYRKGILDRYFKMLEEEYDVVTMVDGSGGLRDLMWSRFPYLKEIDALRFAPCFLFAKKSLLSDLDFRPVYYKGRSGIYLPELDHTTTNEDWFDSFGIATLNILATNPKWEVIEDDRSSIYTDSEKSFASGLVTDKNLGYYHLRNWSMAVNLINTRERHVAYYKHNIKIIPSSEACRLLGWYQFVLEQTGALTQKLKTEICKVVGDYGISIERWNEYVVKFNGFHLWNQRSNE